MEKDKVLTVDMYYDGIVSGVATLNGKPCIFEADYIESGNYESDLYYLTPLDIADYETVMAEWNRWLRWVKEHGSAKGWREQKAFQLSAYAKRLATYRACARRAQFSGGYKNFHSPMNDLYVEWSE